MNSADLQYFIGKKVEVSVPHLVLPRPFYYHGKITTVTDDKITLHQANNKGIIDIKIENIIRVKSLNWEVEA